jgi:plasmid stabilization system protein ParE
MRSVIQLTPKAEDDVLEVWLFVAHDNPKAANKLIADIESGWRRLALATR